MQTILYLVRHASSAPADNIPEAEWPLSAEGERRALALSSALAGLGIERVFSSPYRRAIATVAPFATQAGLEIEILPGLRERKLTAAMTPEWPEIVKRAWADLDFAPPGCESGRACLARIKQCLDGLAVTNSGRTILACSHGNAIGLFLRTMDPSFGYDEWRAMRNPHLLRIDYRTDGPALNPPAFEPPV